MSDAAPATRPPAPVPVDDPRVEALRHLLGVVDRLRAPDGCPWDLEQTEASMAPCLVEEAHELQEAIEVEGPADAAAEAGDVLTNVLLICRIAQQAGRYDLADAARASAEKLVRRHPHVFGEETTDESGQVLRRWDEIKRAERAARAADGADADTSALAGIPAALPALQRAARTCGKAVRAGFAWPTVAGCLEKVHEELGELEAELSDAARTARWQPELPAAERARVEAELGDLLLASAYLGEYLGVDPEAACRAAVRRFEGRFRRMEARVLAGDGGATLADHDLDHLEAAWQAEKAND